MSTEGVEISPARVSKVLIVDDHPLYSDALEAALSIGFGPCTIRKTRTLADTLTVLGSGFQPDLVLLDLKLPDVSGISGFRELRRKSGAIPILVISSLAGTDLVQSLLDSGAAGFLPKDSPATVLNAAVREVMSGRRYIPAEIRAGANDDHAPGSFDRVPELAALTPQQTRILKLICAGKPNKQIAYELSLAEATVKAHITALLRRLRVNNRTQAVVAVEAALARHAGTEPEARAFLAQ